MTIFANGHKSITGSKSQSLAGIFTLVTFFATFISILSIMRISLYPFICWADDASAPQGQLSGGARVQKEMPNCLSSVQFEKPSIIGNELKRKLEQFYNKLPKRLNKNYVDVSNIVSCYIPVGTSFSKAELALQDAGFKIYPGPWSQSAANGLSVRAEIDPYEQGIIWRSSLIVFLAPRGASEYDNIASVDAAFYFSDL
jgi:hypothetical protein